MLEIDIYFFKFHSEFVVGSRYETHQSWPKESQNSLELGASAAGKFGAEFGAEIEQNENVFAAFIF